MKASLVVTSINKPNKILRRLAKFSKINGWEFIIIGDRKSPNDFKLNSTNFLSLRDQKKLNFNFSKICPENSYARKNIGYLIAMKNFKVIVETDDDNYPKTSFFKKRELDHHAITINNKGWINIYDLFLSKKKFIWPRGLPLDQLNNKIKVSKSKVKNSFYIQQGVCDNNPDVDSIFRLINDKINIKFLNKKFNLNKSLSPFNSQNTTWFKEAFPLMYLPVTCTMRCTDIWRGLIALYLFRLNSKKILFHGPTTIQYRNPHNILNDFVDEIPMFQDSNFLIHELSKLNLRKGTSFYSENLLKIYRRLIDLKIFEKKELIFLKAWLEDISINL